MTTTINNQTKTLSDWSYLGIDKHFNKILKHEANVLKDRDPEELHQMRVGTRRLRSTLTGFAAALNLPDQANQKQVGKVARVLGELRDLDVLKEALEKEYQPFLPEPESKALDKVFKELAKRRKKAFKQVKVTLKGKHYLNLKKAFKNWLTQPQYSETGSISINTILPDLLLPQVSNLLLHPGWLIGVKSSKGETSFTDNRNKLEVEKLLEKEGLVLHELRKEAKRSRYNMELFEQFYGEQYQDYLEDIKTVQSILGEMQDCFVLADFLTQVFGKNLNKKMPILIKKLQEIRYKKWQEWQALQHKFLDTQTRQDFHFAILQPTSKSAERQLPSSTSLSAVS